MAALQSYEVSLTDEEDNVVANYSLLLSQTSLSAQDMDNCLTVGIGRNYVVGVWSVNSIGASETSSTNFGWVNLFGQIRN